MMEAFLVSADIVARAEISDKTQIATIALGEKLFHKMPGKQVHAIAAFIFAAPGMPALPGWGSK